MIPLTLSLRNFMCYRENVPPLNLEGVHVVLLCGDNGNGKSALFDAMTWALWGKSRAKSDDDLVHLGEREMEVELEFSVAGQRYRVIRKHTKGSPLRPGQTDLQLQIANGNGFKPVTGDTLRETERKIIEILHMDYQTFINSAFLVQGRADEFSIKQPAQRKQIIADILGLSSYDSFEEKAKSLSRDREIEAGGLASSIAEIEAQLADRSKYEMELRRWLGELTRLEAELKERQMIVSDLRQQKEFLERKQEQLIDLTNALEETKKELSTWGNRIIQHQNKIKDYEQIVAERLAIDNGYQQYLQVKELNDEFNSKLGQLFNLTEGIRKAEKTIEEAETVLVAERAIVQTRITERENKVAKLPRFEEEMSRVEKRLTELTEIERDITNKKQHIQQLISVLQRLESHNASLEEELKALKEKLDLLTEAGVKCPLCESELGVDGRERLKVKLEAEVMTKTKTQKDNEEEMENKRLEHWTLEKELAEKEPYLSKERPERQAQLGMLKGEMAEARRSEEELAKERVRLQEIEGHLQTKDFATEARRVLSELHQEQLQLGYDRGKHEVAKRELLKLQEYEELKRKSEEADRIIGEEKATLVSAEQAASNLRTKIQEMELRQENLRQELLVLPQIIDQLNTANQTYEGLQEEERQVRDEISRLEERLSYCGSLEKSKKEKERLLRKNSEETGIYKELAEAFGKKGIQALLIERALPEIEVEANRLLGRMTDNRMFLKLETQRGTKKGGIIETLDIKIADELGTRSYEMYSGGESFRINLALRIALSKLLVKRAGASMPILIIDEGFGTQDSSGREKLVEAINSIQDDFEKIIVVTHLEELKEYFPMRINVTKAAAGSTLFID